MGIKEKREMIKFFDIDLIASLKIIFKSISCIRGKKGLRYEDEETNSRAFKRYMNFKLTSIQLLVSLTLAQT